MVNMTGGKKALIDEKNEKDETPLMTAAYNGALKICQFFITKHASLEKHDEVGNTVRVDERRCSVANSAT